MGSQSGSVMSATSTSPSENSLIWSMLVRMFTWTRSMSVPSRKRTASMNLLSLGEKDRSSDPPQTIHVWNSSIRHPRNQWSDFMFWWIPFWWSIISIPLIDGSSVVPTRTPGLPLPASPLPMRLPTARPSAIFSPPRSDSLVETVTETTNDTCYGHGPFVDGHGRVVQTTSKGVAFGFLFAEAKGHSSRIDSQHMHKTCLPISRTPSMPLQQHVLIYWAHLFTCIKGSTCTCPASKVRSGVPCLSPTSCTLRWRPPSSAKPPSLGGPGQCRASHHHHREPTQCPATVCCTVCRKHATKLLFFCCHKRSKIAFWKYIL